MTTVKQKQPIGSKATDIVAEGSRNELRIIQQGNLELVDARDVYARLEVKTYFNDWLKRRIEEYGFEPGKDFYSNLSKSTGGRPYVEVHLTWDMVKELCMVEKNEIGRNCRRYFIEVERQRSGIHSLGKEREVLKGLKPRKINDRVLWPYREVLARTGYSVKSSSSGRRHRYWGQFVKEGNLLFCTDFIVSMLYSNRQAMNRRAEALQAQPVLPLNFGETPGELPGEKGGRHD